MEVNGEPCTGEDISSKLEDTDVQDGRRFDTERDTFACLEDTQLTLKRPEERTVVLQKPGRTFPLPAAAADAG